ncbi:hypothetical protein [Paraliomyxa miuraensis]|uniref:hypothetical protein n=1 Tax=Paraliomyxa miuraensis TaxID=376150 RepID=UPI00225697FF|nr:hypothetical protein [Paraliomyxa miuraensis]MCX4247072.1 hypothetical protein [Paraliomyxa miuraensis]
MLASTPALQSLWYTLLDNAFTLALLLVFAVVVASTLARRYRRDKCLTLLDDFHVTFADAKGRAQWGDLVVVPDGIEVRFDAAVVEAGGLAKGSALIFERAVRDGVGLCRSVDALTPAERLLREAQLQRCVRPGPVRLVLRALAGFVDALGDALSRAVMLAVAQVSSAVSFSTGFSQEPEDGDAHGPSLPRTRARAYEPLLERWLGRPVVVRLWSAAAPEHPVDLPGHLVEYSADYLVVFNLEREVRGELELELRGAHRGDGFVVEWDAPTLWIHCTGPDVLVVESLTTAGGTTPIDCALLRGAYAELHIGDHESCTLRLHRTRRVDVVCPRARAIVTHGGELDVDAREAGIVGHGARTELRTPS